MKLITNKIAQFSQEDIESLELNKCYQLTKSISINLNDVEISSADIPGFSVATNNGLTVALDITLSEELKNEGLAREFINRIQNIRKDHGFEVTDQIKVLVEKNDLIMTAIKNNLNYICEETLAKPVSYTHLTLPTICSV